MIDNLQEMRSQLIQLIADAENKLRNRDEMIRRHRALYEMRHYTTDASAGLSQSQKRLVNQYSYQSNAPTNTVDLTTGILSHNGLRFKAYNGLRPTKDSDAEAGDIERLCAGIIQVNVLEQEVDLHHDLIHNASIDGGVALRCVWVNIDDEEPPTEIQMGALDKAIARLRGQPTSQTEPGWIRGCPVKIHVIPLANMLYLPGGPKGRWSLVAYRSKRTIADIRTEFPDYKSGQLLGLAEMQRVMAEFYDVWFWNGAEVWNAILADQELLRCQPMDGYADLPYTIAFFRPNESEDTSMLGLSALYPIEDDVRFYEDRVSHTMRWLDIWANLPLAVKTRDGRPVEVDAIYGKTVNLGVDESIGFIAPGSEPPDHDKLIGLLKQSISDGSFPPVVAGAGPGGMNSGYGLSQLAEGGRIRLEQPKRQLELLWTITMFKALSLFRQFAPDKGMQVFGMYRGKEFSLNHLVGSQTSGFIVQINLDPHFPQDEARLIALGNQALAIKGLSRRTVQERFFGVDDPDEENRRIMLEAMQADPRMAEMVMREIAKEYGLDFPVGPTGQGGSAPRQPIAQPLMGNPEQGVMPLPLAGSPQAQGDQERLMSAIGGMGG